MALHKIETLKALHRGEIAATETYVQALEHLEQEAIASELTAIRDEHREFANDLRQLIHDSGGEPDQGSRTWDYWTRAVEGGNQFEGKATALQALQEGETLGIHTCEAALKETLPEATKEFIRGSLLPQSKAHIVALERMMRS